MSTDYEHEYDWLVREDAVTWGPGPDAGPVIDVGTRRLRRRRSGIAAGAAGLVAAAVVVPLLTLGGSGDGPALVPDEAPSPAPYAGTSSGPSDSPDSPGSPDTSDPAPEALTGCGYFSCLADATPDRTPLLGDLLEVGPTPSGVPQAVWASRRELVDPATGKTIVGPVVMAGFLDGEQRLEGAFAQQPGHEFFFGCDVVMTLYHTFQGGWAVVGTVEGDATAVTYDGGRGDGSVLTSTTVLDGWTVFFATGPVDGTADFPTSFSADLPRGQVSEKLADCGAS